MENQKMKNNNLTLMLDKISSILKKKKSKKDAEKDLNLAKQEKEISEEMEKVKKDPRKIKFAFKELNDLYQQVKEFAFENIEGKKILLVESVVENGKTFQVLTWAGTYRFKAPEGGGNWKLYKRNWKKEGYPWFEINDNNISEFKIPDLQLLPIFVQAKEKSMFEARDYLKSSLMEMFETAGFPSIGNTSNWINKVLEKNGFPLKLYNQNESELDDDLLWKAKHTLQLKRSEMVRKIENSLVVLENILIERLCGKKRKNDKRNNLKTFEMAYRGFKSQIWKMMDKKDFGNLASMYWMEPIYFKTWLTASLNNEKISTIVNHNKALLSFLQILPTKDWSIEKISDPNVLSTLIFGNQLPEELKEKALEHTKLLLKLPFSLSNVLIKGVRNKASIINVGHPIWGLIEAWQKNELPTFVQLMLLKNAHKLYFEKNTSNNWKLEPITFRTEDWIKDWCDCVKIMIEHYKTQTGSRSVQKIRHPIWKEIFKTFNENYANFDSVRKFETLSPFFENMPIDYSWYPIIQRKKLDQSLSQSQPLSQDQSQSIKLLSTKKRI